MLSGLPHMFLAPKRPELIRSHGTHIKTPCKGSPCKGIKRKAACSHSHTHEELIANDIRNIHKEAIRNLLTSRRPSLLPASFLSPRLQERSAHVVSPP